MGHLLYGSPHVGRPGIDRAIVFVTDRGYLAQSIIAASQTAAQPDVIAVADILIFLVDIPDDEREHITQATGAANFNFIFLDSSAFLSDFSDKLPPLHVPRATLGRLVIEQRLPAAYNHVVYLDGDIQIVGPISKLVSYTVPDDYLLTACDRLDYGGKYNSPQWYMRQLHVPSPAHYFNAGIIAASRSAWRRHSNAAMEFLINEPERCKHHDQSALNAVNAGRRDILSPEYNFNTWFKEAQGDKVLEPRIVHFTGPLKPWNSIRGPWLAQYRHVYEQFLEDHPFFRAYMSITTKADASPAKRFSKNHVKLIVKAALTRLGQIRKHAVLQRYLRNVRFANLEVGVKPRSTLAHVPAAAGVAKRSATAAGGATR